MSDRAFSFWLKGELLRHEWTPADFSRRSGFSSGVVSNWLGGKRVPEPASCDQIADVLGLRPATVLIAAGHLPSPEPLDDPRREELRGLVERVPEARLDEAVSILRVLGRRPRRVEPSRTP